MKSPSRKTSKTYPHIFKNNYEKVILYNKSEYFFQVPILIGVCGDKYAEFITIPVIFDSNIWKDLRKKLAES